MFNENDIAMLIAVIFGFAFGWGYYWLLFKPNQEKQNDFSKDIIRIQVDGVELLSITVEQAFLHSTYHGSNSPLCKSGGFEVSLLPEGDVYFEELIYDRNHNRNLVT